MKAKTTKLLIAAALALILLGSAIWALAWRQPTTAKAALSHLPGGSTIGGMLTSNDVWGPGTITITGDILITPTVTIVITPNTTVQVATTDGANLGIDPSRIEYIVGGTLQVNGPVTFTSQSGTPVGGDWYGIRFRPGSDGWLDQVTVEYGVVGVLIDHASPDLTNNTIRYMHGDDGTVGASGLLGTPGGNGTDGDPAYGIYLTGTSTSLIQSNTIYSIKGSSGGSGGNGSGGVGVGANGADGGDGGNGGLAIGLFVGNGSTPQVLANTVMTITGGAGG